MAFIAALLTLLCYAAAGYLGWLRRTPVFVFALLSGHISALATPLWSRLYGVVYDPAFTPLTTLGGQPLPWAVMIAAAWYYPLPALIILVLYREHWWFPGYLSGLLTYLVFLLYHLVIETLGLRVGAWTYNDPLLPFGISNALLAAAMAALVSLGLTYLLLVIHRSAPFNLALVLLPATLALSLFIHGILGGPLWVALILPQAQETVWVAMIGMASTLALLVWAVLIITGGLKRIEQRLTV